MQTAIHFGIPLCPSGQTVVPPLDVPIRPGCVLLVVGPSGSGKSTALREIARHFAGAVTVGDIRFPRESAIVDGIAPWADFGEAIALMTRCGLGEAGLWVRRYEELSDGERFRARLAKGVALLARGGSDAPLICDEFGANLHRRSVIAIAYNLRKLAEQRRFPVVVASTDEAVARDLQPDTILRLSGHGEGVVEPGSRRAQRAVRQRSISLRRRLVIEEGRKRDYERFASMHYRATDELGFVDKVFVMRDGSAGDLLGIVVYAHGPIELSLRNEATGGIFVRNAKRLNREMRILRRLVIHPDVRGCGLGHHLVRRTLPRIGTQYVECLATMGAYNPVFEKAGMEKIGQYAPSQKRLAALAALRKLDVDPHGAEFVSRVCRSRRVRKIVTDVVYDWYFNTTAGGERRVARQAPQWLAQTFRCLVGLRPVYFLWRRRRSSNLRR